MTYIYEPVKVTNAYWLVAIGACESFYRFYFALYLSFFPITPSVWEVKEEGEGSGAVKEETAQTVVVIEHWYFTLFIVLSFSCFHSNVIDSA